MAVREILLYPDPLLKQKCDLVTDFGAPLAELVRDLRETLAASPGVGIAAPQIGVLQRVVLIDVTGKFPERRQLVLVNPRITTLEEYKIIREGCLSIPEFTANVRRADKVVFEALDEHGQPYAHRTDGLEAIAIQHETDHLDGVLFLDRVACLKTDVFRRKTKPSARAQS
ncbi:MAG: peptide deformylase [Armatimonadetes bacterium]|nr:peptide deformylase [Armatimonadota bacterium]